VSRQVFLSNEAREALNRYLEVRGKKPGPLFPSRSGERLGRQNVDDILKQIAAQANAKRRQDEKIHLSAHTLLRWAAEKKGVQYAMELARPDLQPGHLALCPAHRRAEGSGTRGAVLTLEHRVEPDPQAA
jgi:integrase